MDQKLDTTLTLLTYKGKVLLMVNNYNQSSDAENFWSMIRSKKKGNESLLTATTRKIGEELNIHLTNVMFISDSVYNNEHVHVYHGKLTDDDVNSIERKEGQEIRFFALAELSKLPLTVLTSKFLAEFGNNLPTLLVN